MKGVVLCSLLVLSWGPSPFLTSSLDQDVKIPLDSLDQDPLGSRTERLVVDSPPPGVDFTGCREEGGLCCLSYVGEVRRAVMGPLLECISREEEVCHTSYITQFSAGQEEQCRQQYQKQCTILIGSVESSSTSEVCLRPLQRVCSKNQEETVHRIRRAAAPPLPGSLLALANQLDATRAAEELEDNSIIPDSDSECRMYYETICSGSQASPEGGLFSSESNCERLPLRLCAGGCRIREGPVTCRNITVPIRRDVPEEKCELVPSHSCQIVTRLVPELIPKTVCELIPKRECQLKFSSRPESPHAHNHLLQTICLRNKTKSEKEELGNDGTKINDEKEVHEESQEENDYGQNSIELVTDKSLQEPQPRMLPEEETPHLLNPQEDLLTGILEYLDDLPDAVVPLDEQMSKVDNTTGGGQTALPEAWLGAEGLSESVGSTFLDHQTEEQLPTAQSHTASQQSTEYDAVNAEIQPSQHDSDLWRENKWIPSYPTSIADPEAESDHNLTPGPPVFDDLDIIDPSTVDDFTVPSPTATEASVTEPIVTAGQSPSSAPHDSTTTSPTVAVPLVDKPKVTKSRFYETTIYDIIATTISDLLTQPINTNTTNSDETGTPPQITHPNNINSTPKDIILIKDFTDSPISDSTAKHSESTNLLSDSTKTDFKKIHSATLDSTTIDSTTRDSTTRDSTTRDSTTRDSTTTDFPTTIYTTHDSTSTDSSAPDTTATDSITTDSSTVYSTTSDSTTTVSSTTYSTSSETASSDITMPLVTDKFIYEKYIVGADASTASNEERSESHPMFLFSQGRMFPALSVDQDKERDFTVSLAEIQKEEGVVTSSPDEIQEESNAVTSSPGEIQEERDAVTNTPGEIQEESAGVSISPGEIKDESTAVTISPDEIQEESAAVTQSPAEIQEENNAITQSLAQNQTLSNAVTQVLSEVKEDTIAVTLSPAEKQEENNSVTLSNVENGKDITTGTPSDPENRKNNIVTLLPAENIEEHTAQREVKGGPVVSSVTENAMTGQIAPVHGCLEEAHKRNTTDKVEDNKMDLLVEDATEKNKESETSSIIPGKKPSSEDSLEKTAFHQSPDFPSDPEGGFLLVLEDKGQNRKDGTVDPYTFPRDLSGFKLVPWRRLKKGRLLKLFLRKIGGRREREEDAE